MVSRGRLRRIEFSTRKYGTELLVDAAMLSAMPAFRAYREPHRLDFYDLLLVTAGSGAFEVDGASHTVRPGQLLITTPGQIRRWNAKGVDGACVFFTADFIRHVFAEARILEQCAFFRDDRPASVLSLDASERRQFLYLFRGMGHEFDAIRRDAADVLAARLCELLVLINRWYAARHAAGVRRIKNGLADRFTSMIDREFRTLQRVQDYADRLGVSTGHLNVVCNRHLGRSASAQIHQRVLLEAKRLLRYTDKPAFAIAQDVGFGDPAYFGRFFLRETGTTPRRYRNER
jgi:AraC family transcriptional regulator, transcriptional activator of pobA